MNFSQMHERLRVELLRRIQRGTLSVSLLSRQTGFGQAHISNFLRSNRQLSLEGLDRVLAAQRIDALDLIPLASRFAGHPDGGETNKIPVVTQAAALLDPHLRPSVIQGELELPASLMDWQTRASRNRALWDRFVAVPLSASDALPMDPVILPDALVIIDRHWNSLRAYRPPQPNVYAVRFGSHIVIRYLDFDRNRLVLRPHNVAFPVELVEIPPGESPGDGIAGRVALILNEL